MISLDVGIVLEPPEVQVPPAQVRRIPDRLALEPDDVTNGLDLDQLLDLDDCLDLNWDFLLDLDDRFDLDGLLDWDFLLDDLRSASCKDRRPRCRSRSPEKLPAP